jgi:Chromo (CHRromatin Organisation MOdifier) domain
MLHPFVKLEPKHYGPFPITKVISDVVFKLKLPYQWLKRKVHPMFHASLLSLYKEMEEHRPNFLEPPLEVVEGAEEYEVEAILGDKTIRRKRHYLIKWKGYANAHNSWEPDDQVHADDLVREYNNKKRCVRGIRLRRTWVGSAPCPCTPSSSPFQSTQLKTSPLSNLANESTSLIPINLSMLTIADNPSAPHTVDPLTYTWEQVKTTHLSPSPTLSLNTAKAMADFYDPSKNHCHPDNPLCVSYKHIHLVCLGIPYNWPVGKEADYVWGETKQANLFEKSQCLYCLDNFLWRQRNPGVQ